MNRLYIDGLGVNAGRINNAAADEYVRQVCNRSYVNGLGVTALQLQSSDPGADSLNRTYIDGLGVNATRLLGIDAQRLERRSVSSNGSVVSLFRIWFNRVRSTVQR